MDKKDVDRTPTGITGFDSLCQGGLVKKSVNMLLGNAGSGKTTFLLQYLYNGATKYNENGLYVSFEQHPKDLRETAELLGMDIKDQERKKKIELIRLAPPVSIKTLQKELVKKINEQKIKRICFDPINILSLDNSLEENLRKEIFDFFTLLKEMDVTILVAGESSVEGCSDYEDISEGISFCVYLADTLIELFSSGISGEGDRALRIFKMRKSSHYRGPIGMAIDDKGIKIFKKQ